MNLEDELAYEDALLLEREYPELADDHHYAGLLVDGAAEKYGTPLKELDVRRYFEEKIAARYALVVARTSYVDGWIDVYQFEERVGRLQERAQREWDEEAEDERQHRSDLEHSKHYAKAYNDEIRYGRKIEMQEMVDYGACAIGLLAVAGVAVALTFGSILVWPAAVVGLICCWHIGSLLGG